MTVSGVSSNIAPLIQSALDINKQLDDLQRQLGSGQKSDTYAGLGSQSGIAVALNAQLSAINSFDDTITNVGTTISLQQTVLQQIANIGSTVQAATVQPSFAIDSTGQTTAQKTAQSQLDQILSLLNTQGGNGYLFSGSGLNQPSVDTADHILNGNGAQAGLKQVIAERNQADLGADGLGRLVIPAAAGTTVSVSEDAASSPFGLKLAAVNSTLTGATVTGPAGSPAAISVDLGASNPNNGDTITYTFALPDGTSQTLQLQATTSAPPGPNQFTIGATPAATAANLQAALTAGVSKIGKHVAVGGVRDGRIQRFLRRSAAAGQRLPLHRHGAGRRNVRQHRFLVHRRGWIRIGAIDRDRAHRSIDDRLLRHAGQRTGHPLDRAKHRGTGGDQLLLERSQCIRQLCRAQSAASIRRSAFRRAFKTSPISRAASPMRKRPWLRRKASTSRRQTMLTTMQQSIEGVDINQVGAQILSLQTSLSASLSTTARMASLNLLSYLAPVTG